MPSRFPSTFAIIVEEVLGSTAVDNAPPHPQTIRSGDFLWLAVAERLPVNSGILGCIFLTGVVYLDLTQKSNKFQKEWNHVKG